MVLAFWGCSAVSGLRWVAFLSFLHSPWDSDDRGDNSERQSMTTTVISSLFPLHMLYACGL